MKINEIIKLLKADFNSTLKSLDKISIEKIIDYLSDNYYNKNISLVSDQLFDLIINYYEKEFKIKYNKIGADVKNKKIKLPYWIGSLDKIKPSTNAFDKWIEKFNGPYVLSYKLDGISSLLIKSNNKILMFTRGNGDYGQDISHFVKLIGINTNNLIEEDAIRGELIMSKENFKKISNTMSNPRNAVSGLINTKKPDSKLLKLIDFVPYSVYSPQLKVSEQLKYIEKKEFIPRTVEYEIKNKIILDDLSKMLIDGRKTYKYEIDGIVVIDDSKYYPLENNTNPSYGFAFKQILTDQIAESTVIDVIWKVSKDKHIKPKIKIQTVEIGGVQISYITAYNAKYVNDNIIGPGAIIKLIRSGDVIPKIEEVIKPADTNKPKMPNIKYKWNDTKVDIIAIDLNLETTNNIIIKKLTYFFKTLDIKWMGESTIEKFVLNGYNDLWKILSADKKKIEEIDGFAKTIIDKIYQSISVGLENRKLEEIMAASQIFGRNIGITKFKLIINSHPNILDIWKEKGIEYTTKLINNISGFDNKTTIKIVDNMNDFIEYLNKFLKLKPNLLNTNKSESNKTFNEFNLKDFTNKTIVFTGFRDKNIEKILELNGSKITTTISKNTNILIASDPNEDSNKIIKAKEFEINIISKEEFYKKIKNN